MPPPVPTEIDLRDCGPLRRIASGGQGTVHELVRDPDSLVYKQYAHRMIDDVDVPVLHRFVALPRELSDEQAGMLTGIAAWPVTVVRRDGVVSGFLMPRAPREFTAELIFPSGPDRVLTQVQYLLNSDRYLAARGLVVGDRFRVELLRDTAAALDLLHELGVVVGDLSPNNLLFSLDRRPRCFFIDCDAMRLAGESILAPVETPGWQAPGARDGTGEALSTEALSTEDLSTGALATERVATEGLATEASDGYKLALLAVRLLARDQETTDWSVLPARYRDVRRLAERGLSADPQRRPAPADWLGPLDRLIARLPADPVVRPAAAPTGDQDADDATDPAAAADTSAAPQSNTASGSTAAGSTTSRGAAAGSTAGNTTRRGRAAAGSGLRFATAWLWVIPVLIGIMLGVLDDGSGSGSDTGGVPRQPITFPGSTPYPIGPLPTFPLPTLPGAGFPGLPSRLFPSGGLYCLLRLVESGSGVDKQRFEDVRPAVQDLACALHTGDFSDVVPQGASPPPDTRSRQAFDRLREIDEYSRFRVTGVQRSGAALVATVQVYPFSSATSSRPCWSLTVTARRPDAAEDYQVTALGTPRKLASCR